MRFVMSQSGPINLLADANRAESARELSALRLLLLDLVERGIVVAMFAWLTWRIVAAASATHQLANLLMLPSEGLVVLFILIRRRTSTVSQRPQDWLFALLATVMPLLVQPASVGSLVPVSFAATLLLMGMFVQIHAKLVLGRSLGCVPAHRGLKLNGPYRFVRHPMYAGYLLSHVAFLLMNPSPWNIAVYAGCYAMQIPRLLAEERLLCRDDRYAKYMQAVRFRLLPGVF